MTHEKSPLTWRPRQRFLRRLSAEFRSAGMLGIPPETLLFTWRFARVQTHFLPIQYMQCRLTALDQEAFGFGEGLTIGQASVSAFAEAWERWWMSFLMSSSQVPTTLTPPTVFTSSNGFAAGRTSESAREVAKRELIERAFVLKAWKEQKGWGPIQPKSLLARALCASVRASGWDIRLFEISTPAPYRTFCALLMNQRSGAVFDSIAFHQAERASQPEVKLIRSTIRSVLCVPGWKAGDSWTLPESGEPLDHARFYLQQENLAAFEFLNAEQLPETRLSGDLLSGIQSTALVDAGEFPAVAVAWNPEWEALAWGKQSISGLNPWPHPIA